MNSITDYIVILAGIYLLYRGWKQGFLNSALGPISLIVCSLIGLLYYSICKDMFKAALIPMIGPFIIKISFYLLRKVLNKASGTKEKYSILSKALGSLFCLLWKGTILAILIIIISIVPPKHEWLERIQTDISKSKTYKTANKLTGYKIPTSKDIMAKTTALISNKGVVSNIRSSEKFKKLMSHKDFESFVTDEVIKEKLQDGNIVGLMTDPKMQTLFSDQEFLKDLINANKEVLKQAEEMNKSSENLLQQGYLPIQN
ncbi:MAG: CvpA family protein [Candidatus Zapsychrus exili]|nr:CvpA family protein [Candidatus Zapsychrus exili]